MSAVIMDGKALAKKVKEEVRAAAARMERRPGLAVILVWKNDEFPVGGFRISVDSCLSFVCVPVKVWLSTSRAQME